MFKVLFNKRHEGRQFYNLARKHNLFKLYLVGWENRVISFKFDNEEQHEVISGIIVNVLKEMGVGHEIVE